MPGSVVYTGENPNYNITITVIYYSKDFHKRETFSSTDKIDIDLKFKGNIWINIDGINDVNLIKDIGKMFDIDTLSMEDIANPEQRVKIDDRDTYILIILKMLQMEILTKDVQYEQLSLVIKKNILITFQETPYDPFEIIRTRLEIAGARLRSQDVSYLAYILIDIIVDNYLLILDEVENEIDEIGSQLIESADRDDLENILALKQNIAVLKKFISPVRELISKLQTRSMLNYFHEDMKYYLGDLNDHGIIVFDTVDMLNNRATELLQLYHSMISNTMNEIMKILAIISTIFMPLSFIVGLYGMNFEYMPELKWHYGYYITLGLMASLVILMIFYFKKKKWGKLYFQKKIKYPLADMRVFSVSMEGIPAKINKLKENHLQNVRFGIDEISGEISLDKPKILAMSIPYEKGWKAYVNGKEVPILRGNYMFSCLSLGRGDFNIELKYRTPGLTISIMLSVASFIILGVMLVLDWRKRKSVGISSSALL